MGGDKAYLIGGDLEFPFFIGQASEDSADSLAYLVAPLGDCKLDTVRSFPTILFLS